MPFGQYKGTSLRRMWETEHGQGYILNFIGRTVRCCHCCCLMIALILSIDRRLTMMAYSPPYHHHHYNPQPAFYHRANTLRNGDLFIRLLDSLHTLGYVMEVRSGPATAITMAPLTSKTTSTPETPTTKHNTHR